MNANISITLGGPLADALNNLAAAIAAMAAIEKAAQPAQAREPAQAEPVRPAKAEKPAPAAPVADEPVATAVKAAVPSIAELRDAADAVTDKHGVAKVKGILKEMGADKLVDLPEDRRAEALERFKGAL